jgi:hypothetical protein
MRRRPDKPTPEGSSERLTLRQADEARADLYAIHDELEFIKQQLAPLPTRRDMARLALIAVLAGAALTVAAVALLGRGL